MESKKVYGLFILEGRQAYGLLFESIEKREEYLNTHICESYRFFDYSIEEDYYDIDKEYFYNKNN